MQHRKITFSQFMKEFRPDGHGRIQVGVPGDISEILFDEVVCDFCNAEITPKKVCQICMGSPAPCIVCKDVGYTEEESNVYILGSWAICEACYKKKDVGR